MGLRIAEGIDLAALEQRFRPLDRRPGRRSTASSGTACSSAIASVSQPPNLAACYSTLSSPKSPPERSILGHGRRVAGGIGLGAGDGRARIRGLSLAHLRLIFFGRRGDIIVDLGLGVSGSLRPLLPFLTSNPTSPDFNYRLAHPSRLDTNAP